MPTPISRLCFCAVLLAVTHRAAAERPATVTPLTVDTGVAAEGQTIIDAPAGQVAGIAGDPAVFRELLPAAAVRPRGSDGGAELIEVEMHEPWPVGVVRWVESLRRRSAPDGSYIVERRAVDDGYFRRLQATWRVSPLGPARCAVTYRVSMELRRWAPTWMVRRGNSAGILGTMTRLRRLSERSSERTTAQRAIN